MKKTWIYGAATLLVLGALTTACGSKDEVIPSRCNRNEGYGNRDYGSREDRKQDVPRQNDDRCEARH